MEKMTPEEIKQFLLDTARTGKLATVREDGRPHVAPIWFDLDGEDLIFTTWHEAVKAKNLRRDPRASLCVDDETPPFAFVIIEGTVEIDENPNLADLKGWATRIGGRYMGQDRAEEYGQRNGVEGELLLRLKPAKVIARKNVAD